MLPEKRFLLIFRDIFEALWSFPFPPPAQPWDTFPCPAPCPAGAAANPNILHLPTAALNVPPCSAREIQPLPKLPYPPKTQELDPPEEIDPSWEVSFPGARSGNGFSGCSSAGCRG